MILLILVFPSGVVHNCSSTSSTFGVCDDQPYIYHVGETLCGHVDVATLSNCREDGDPSSPYTVLPRRPDPEEVPPTSVKRPPDPRHTNVHVRTEGFYNVLYPQGREPQGVPDHPDSTMVRGGLCLHRRRQRTPPKRGKGLTLCSNARTHGQNNSRK